MSLGWSSRVPVAKSMSIKCRAKPVRTDVLRLRLQRVIKENRMYRTIYHNQIALFPPKGRNGEPMEEGLPESLRFQEKDEKLKKRGHKLQKQYQDAMKILEGVREKNRRLLFEQDRFRQQLSKHGVSPAILTNYEYLDSLQMDELVSINKYCGERQLLMLNNQFCTFLKEQLCIPSALHPFLFRKYDLFIHPSASKSIRRIQSQKTRFFLSESPTNPRMLETIQFQYSELCNNECLLVADKAIPEVVGSASFVEFWKGLMLGYSDKQRLFRLMTEKDTIEYETVKQMVCDFLRTHHRAIESIHEVEETDFLCEEGLCCHCCIYITTVAAAILFDLTGLTSTMIRRSQIMSSNLVREGYVHES